VFSVPSFSTGAKEMLRRTKKPAVRWKYIMEYMEEKIYDGIYGIYIYNDI